MRDTLYALSVITGLLFMLASSTSGVHVACQFFRRARSGGPDRGRDQPDDTTLDDRTAIFTALVMR